MHTASRSWFVCVAAWSLSAALAAQQAPVKVFVLAGQSNMEGKARDELWERQAVADETAAFFASFRRNGNKNWVVRDDVFVKFFDRRGPLTLGYGSPQRSGCEFAFGLRIGDALEAPVLLIKTAWGGRSLQRDFRSPSAGMPSEEQLRQELAQAVRRVEKHNAKNRRDDPLPTMQDITAKYGASYREMIHEVRETLAGFDELFPQWKGREVELAGFVWFQGWNDLFDGAEQRYAENLRHLIDDVREDLGVADLPVVVAAMGQNGAEPAKGAMKVIQDAQLGMPSVPGYEHSVRAFATDELQDEAAAALYPEWKERQEEWQRVGSDRPYHYLGSAIWFSRIGFRMADEMLALLGEK